MSTTTATDADLDLDPPCPFALPDDYDDGQDDYVEAPCCPHCDAFVHGPTSYCWCIGCDACDRARAADAAYRAELRATFAAAQAKAKAAPAPVVLADDEPF